MTERLFLLCFKIKLEFGSVGIWREENFKTCKKTLGARREPATNPLH